MIKQVNILVTTFDEESVNGVQKPVALQQYTVEMDTDEGITANLVYLIEHLMNKEDNEALDATFWLQRALNQRIASEAP